jgi:hypothetical protein
MANVLLASGGYDHTIRFWEVLPAASPRKSGIRALTSPSVQAKSGTNYRTLQYGESQVRALTSLSEWLRRFVCGSDQQAGRDT